MNQNQLSLTHTLQVLFPNQIVDQCVDDYGNYLYILDNKNTLLCYSLKSFAIAGRFGLPSGTTTINVSPASKYIAVICNTTLHIYSLPTMNYIGTIENVIYFLWSNDAFLDIQHFLVLTQNQLSSYRIAQDNKTEILEKMNERNTTGKKLIMDNGYNIACLFGQKEIYQFNPKLTDRFKPIRIEGYDTITDLCLCNADIFVLRGFQLQTIDGRKKLNLPFRGSEFRIISHFNSIIAYDSNRIYIIDPNRFNIETVIETMSISIQQLQTNTKLSILTFVVPPGNSIGMVCSDDYIPRDSLLRIFEHRGVKIHTKQSVSQQRKHDIVETGVAKPKNTAPRSDYSVFVGKTNGLSEEDIHQAFSVYGNIKAVRLQNGYGFVDFEDQQAKEKALNQSILKIKDKEVTVNNATGNSNKRN